jgi:hypothetical protein
MVLKAEDWREDPYKNVRRDVPTRPGKVIRHKKEYLKPLARREEKMEVEEGIKDYYDDIILNEV